MNPLTRNRKYIKNLVLSLKVLIFIILFRVFITQIEWVSTNFGNNTQRKITFWYPIDGSNCQGNLRFKFPYQDSSEPHAIVIREATVDWRHVSVNDVRDRGISGAYRRVLILMTILPDGKNNNITEIEKSIQDDVFMREVSLRLEDGNIVENVSVSFDYLIEDGRCQRDCGADGPCSMKEWQSVVTLKPNNQTEESQFSKTIDNLSRSRAYLELNIPVKVRSRKKVQMTKLTLALACVSSLSSTTAIPILQHMPSRTEKCRDARSAVVLAGAPMFGSNSHDRLYWKQIAHFSARHLFGNTWFHSVVVAAHPKHTISYIRMKCNGKNAKCINRHVRQNYVYFNEIRNVVEKELEKLQVPESFWKNIVITSFCNLGSEFETSERAYACQSSFFGGQKIWSHFAYTAFGPYYKWAASLDMDEILIDELALEESKRSYTSRFQSAEEKFNLLQAETRKSSFYATWFDFHLPQLKMKEFTIQVMKGQALKFSSLSSQASGFLKDKCYGAGGKVITSCRSTVSFMIHFSLNVKGRKDLSRAKCAPKRNSERRTSINETKIFTYHARKQGARYGNCLFTDV